MRLHQLVACVALVTGASAPASADILQVSYSGYLSTIDTCTNCTTHTTETFAPGAVPWTGTFTINTANGLLYFGAIASMSKIGGTGINAWLGLPPITNDQTAVGSLNFGTADSLGNDYSLVSINDRAVYGTAQFYTLFKTQDDAFKIPAPGQLPDGNMKQLGVNLMSPLFPFTFDQNISLSDPAGFGVNSLFYSSTSYNFGCPTCYNLVGYNGILTSITVSDTTLSVPEPSTWAVMLAGLFGIGFAGRIRARPKTLSRGRA